MDKPKKLPWYKRLGHGVMELIGQLLYQGPR